MGVVKLNRELLLSKIEEKKLSKSYVAEYLGLTRQGFYNKIDGKTEFVGSEIKRLIFLLGLQKQEQQDIFFADDVGKNDNIAEP